MIVVEVSTSRDGEPKTPADFLSYSAAFFKREGCQIVKNEISLIGNEPCVRTEVDESPRQGEGAGRRYSLVIQESEYGLNFKAPSMDHLAALAPFIDAYVSRCHFDTPKLISAIVLGGRLELGVPASWERIRDEPALCVWKVPGQQDRDGQYVGRPLEVCVYLLEENCGNDVQTGLLSQWVSSITEKPIADLFVDVAVRSVSGSGSQLIQLRDPRRRNWALDIAKLPNGLVVALETEHTGAKVEFEGLLIEPFRRALLSSLKAGAVQVIDWAGS